MENDGGGQREQRRIAANGRRHSPTREMVLRTVEAQSAPVSIPALSRACGLHENTLRGHLEQLHADGYVRRELATSAGRGRPAWLWQAVRAEPADPYAGLAGALADTLARTSADAVGEAREAGRSWGLQIAADHGQADGTAREAVVAMMREQGFAPVDTGDDVLLRRCPLIEAATKHPTIVCAVHQGMIDGILAARHEHGDSTLLPFTSPGECTLRLRAAE